LSHFHSWPLVIMGGVITLGLAHLRIMQAAQPLRLELAEKGERFLARPELPPDVRGQVKWMLDSAFGLRKSIIMGFVAVPIIAILLIFRERYIVDFKENFAAMSNDSKVFFGEIMRLHSRITLANHPILWAVLELEIILIVSFAVLLKGILRGTFPSRGDRDDVISLVEHGKFMTFAQ
jgi:hypothetical protein